MGSRVKIVTLMLIIEGGGEGIVACLSCVDNVITIGGSLLGHLWAQHVVLYVHIDEHLINWALYASQGNACLLFLLSTLQRAGPYKIPKVFHLLVVQWLSCW